MQTNDNMFSQPLAIVFGVILAIGIMVYQNGSKARKADKTRAAFIRIKSDCIDKLEAYEISTIEKLLSAKGTKDYEKLMECVTEFDMFCVDLLEDKFNKRVLYEDCRGVITDHLKDVVKLASEEKDATDDFFEWFEAESKFHVDEEKNSFLQTLEREKEENA